MSEHKIQCEYIDTRISSSFKNLNGIPAHFNVLNREMLDIIYLYIIFCVI